MYQLLNGGLPKRKYAGSRFNKDKYAARINGIITKCMESNPEDRYQRVTDIQQELRLVKNALLVNKARQGLVFKLEAVLIVILSIVSYFTAVMGIMGSNLNN